MTDSNVPVTDEQLLDNLVAAQDHIRELAVARDFAQRHAGKLEEDSWRLRLVLQTVWRAQAHSVEDAVGRCGFAADDILPLLCISAGVTV